MSDTIDASEWVEMWEKKKPSKYKNRIATRIIDGKEVKFHSEMEARRYDQLAQLQNEGVIDRLRLQPRYKLALSGVQICTYVADFAYLDFERRLFIVEDVKGVKTEAYRLKKKMMKAQYGIDIQEVKA
jgi:hypothetical protein